MVNRIRALQKALTEKRLDGYLVTSLTNIRYLCGFTGSNGMMLVTRSRATFYTDFRYQEQVKTEVKGCAKRVLERDLYAGFPVEELKGVRRLGVEKSHLTLARFELLRQQIKKTKLIPSEDLVLQLRRKKSPQEVALIEKAQRVTEQAFARVLKLIKPGVTEKDLSLEIEFQFRRFGEPAFGIIVASGENAAKPHARAGNRRLKKGDCITFDIGCRIDGYCSDMTRTVFLGKPSDEMRQVYEAVLNAQNEALAVIEPGVPCKLVDLAARDYLNRIGLGKFFGHSLGHGVGLEVHEEPRLAKTSNQTLEIGDVVTVEPGVYLPGKGGVRIEDMVYVTRKGFINLTRASKKLLIL
ncbi:MAG: Xaa-Pro peptidase family protein [candidate division WOR-3 bacterium]|jgi:Xaa-Pro aminopeptidase|nr:Xaa-Pro peptidase family protein [candidate division WOR-3 bacterium]MCR4424535.1 Xaa-Pro peptidase family protein [candidate division WOR-3 bacterium]MDH7519301.1 Xaa-Pro peptidase family protein [bacterium]